MKDIITGANCKKNKKKNSKTFESRTEKIHINVNTKKKTKSKLQY